MRLSPPADAKKRGLRCPKCRREVDNRYVASSYPGEGGHVRRRFCQCHAEIVSLEAVIGADLDCIIIFGLQGQNYGGPGGRTGVGNPKSQVMQMARSLGGKTMSITGPWRSR